MLVRHRDRLLDYLARGGMLVSFEEIKQSLPPGVDRVRCRVETSALVLAQNPLLGGQAPDDARWYGHGAFTPPRRATELIWTVDCAMDRRLALLYLDEHSFAPGRLLDGTLDLDCHVGYGSDIPRARLRNLFAWALAPQRTLVGAC